MAVEVDWTAHFDTKSLRKAEKLVARLQTALGRELDVRRLAAHHGAAFYEVRFRVPLVAVEESEVVLEVLRLAGSLAPQWEVGMLRETGRLAGWARDEIVVAGIDLVEFDVFADSAPDVEWPP